METNARIFRRTRAGTAAWEDQKSGIPAAYRRILGVINGEIHSDLLRSRLSSESEAHIVRWLAELLTLKLIESVPDAPQPSRDFTSKFKITELDAAFHKR